MSFCCVLCGCWLDHKWKSTIIASSRVLVSADTIGRSLVRCSLKCNKFLFDWRALKLKVSVSCAGCTFVLDWFDEASDNTFLWDAFITKFLCNLLLMSWTKLFNTGSGWANFGGEGGAKPNYQKVHNTIKCRRRIGRGVLHWTSMSKADQAVLLVGPFLPPSRALYLGFRPGDSESDICWTNKPSLPRSDLWWVQWFPILGPPMNKDEGMDKQRLGPSCILTPCSRPGY